MELSANPADPFSRNEDASRRSIGLHARGQVHCVAHHGIVFAKIRSHVAGQDQTTVDPDAHTEHHSDAGFMALTELPQKNLHRQRGPAGPVGVVLMGDRGAIQRHHVVAYIFVDEPVLFADGRPQPFKHFVHYRMHLLRVQFFTHGCEPADIGKHDRHITPLIALQDGSSLGWGFWWQRRRNCGGWRRRRFFDLVSTVATKFKSGRVVKRTLRTIHSGQNLRLVSFTRRPFILTKDCG